MVYLAHKYGGNAKEKALAREIWEDYCKSDLTETYINPIECFSHLSGIVDEETILISCLELLACCDKVIVTSEISEGVKREINEAERLNIPVEYMLDN